MAKRRARFTQSSLKPNRCLSVKIRSALFIPMLFIGKSECLIAKSMSKDSILVNLSDRAVKRELMAQIGRLSGPHEILIKAVKPTRSLNANRYYWIAVVQPFTEWLREEYGDMSITKEQAHEVLKIKFLGMKERRDEKTGIVLRDIPRTRDLDVAEFNEYVESCIQWLADFFNILVVPCEEFYERPAPTKRTKD